MPICAATSPANTCGVFAQKTRASAPAPSSRRESLPPLRPISIPPSRTSGLLPPSLPPSPATQRGRDALLGTAVAALAVAAAYTLAPPWPRSRSFRGLHVDVLYSARIAQEASGFGVVLRQGEPGAHSVSDCEVE